jgi:hypothetical protein
VSEGAEARGARRHALDVHNLLREERRVLHVLQERFRCKGAAIQAGRLVAVCVQLAEHRRRLAVDRACTTTKNMHAMRSRLAQLQQ